MPTTTKTKSSLIPNLAGIIKTEDLYKKMKFDYVPWAKTAQLLREHADGWMFHLQSNHTENSSCDYVFQAPNGTGYLMGFYEHIDTQERGPLYPFAITDNANRPIKLDQISSTHIQNSHRRCLCACACFTFGLAYELWAQIEIQEANEPAPTPVKKEIARSPQRGAYAKKIANEMITGKAPTSTPPEQYLPLLNLERELRDLAPNLRSTTLQRFKTKHFPKSDIAGNKGLFELIKTEQHINDVKAIIEDIKSDSP
tara:strand:+ start:121 stop:885 length:765 start_codon:yes stop_codon:yes gene_type:complete